MTRPPIWLAPNEPKCIGAACRRPGGPCARREVAYVPGRLVGDYSVPNGYSFAECRTPMWIKWVDPDKAVKPVDVKQPKAWIGE